MVERITAHPLLHDERLVSLGLAYATAGVDLHAWARDRGGGAPSARKNGRRVSFNDKSLVSVREIEAREEPPEPEIKAIPKGTSKVRHSALSLFVADRIDASLAGAERAAATKRLAKEFALLRRKDKAAADALAARAKALNDALPSSDG